MQILIVDISHDTVSKKATTPRRMIEIKYTIPQSKAQQIENISWTKFYVILSDFQFYYWFAAVIATNNNADVTDMNLWY